MRHLSRLLLIISAVAIVGALVERSEVVKVPEAPTPPSVVIPTLAPPKPSPTPSDKLEKASINGIDVKGKKCDYSYGYDRTVAFTTTGCNLKLTPLGSAFKVQYKPGKLVYWNREVMSKPSDFWNDDLTILCFPPDKPTERDLKSDSGSHPWHSPDKQFSNCLEVSRYGGKETTETYKMKLFDDGKGADIMEVLRMPGFWTITFSAK